VCDSPGATVIPVLVGTPSFSQVLLTPWKWTVWGWLASVLSSVTSKSSPSRVRITGPGTLAGRSSACHAQTRGSSTGPPIALPGWAGSREVTARSVTRWFCSVTSTTCGGAAAGRS